MLGLWRILCLIYANAFLLKIALYVVKWFILKKPYNTIFAQRDYAPAVQVLLGEMLSATALLASTLKIKGRISLQIQAAGTFKWAMAGM